MRLTSGYQLDAAGEAIERQIVARPMGRNILWTAQINMAETTATWEDITPRRLDGFERVDFRNGRKRG